MILRVRGYIRGTWLYLVCENILGVSGYIEGTCL